MSTARLITLFLVGLAALAQAPVESGSAAAETAEPGGAALELMSPAERGDILMARKRYREAIDVYKEGVREAAVMFNKMGIAYHQLMDFRSALDYYERALQLDPDYAEAINNIGTVYYARKNYGKAIEQYNQALRHAPKSASIYSNLGTAFFARKKYKEAFDAYQRAIDLDPDVFEHRSTAGSLLQERSVEERAKFHFYLAKTYAKAGMVERALLYIRKALEEGFDDRERFRSEPEFAALQELEEFQTLMELKPRVL